MTKELRFNKDGYDFLVNEYIEVGPKLKGMSENKIFYDQNKYFLNLGDKLYEVLNFRISKDGNEIEKSELLFDTKTRIGAMIVCQREILVIHRIKPNEEYYVYPGGHLKQNELIEEGLNREIFEETGINIKGIKRKLIKEDEREGYGPEKYFLIRLEFLPKSVFGNNPEDTTDISDLLWLDIISAKNLQNLYPIGLINLVQEEE